MTASNAAPRVINQHYGDVTPQLRETCPCGDWIMTETRHEHQQWSLAHAHHRTEKAREHFRSRQYQHGLPKPRR